MITDLIAWDRRPTRDPRRLKRLEGVKGKKVKEGGGALVVTIEEGRR